MSALHRIERVSNEPARSKRQLTSDQATNQAPRSDNQTHPSLLLHSTYLLSMSLCASLPHHFQPHRMSLTSSSFLLSRLLRFLCFIVFFYIFQKFFFSKIASKEIKPLWLTRLLRLKENGNRVVRRKEKKKKRIQKHQSVICHV